MVLSSLATRTASGNLIELLHKILYIEGFEMKEGGSGKFEVLGKVVEGDLEGDEEDDGWGVSFSCLCLVWWASQGYHVFLGWSAIVVEIILGLLL